MSAFVLQCKCPLITQRTLAISCPTPFRVLPRVATVPVLSLGEAMNQRDKAGGKVVKTQRRRALKRRNTPKVGRTPPTADANQKIELLERRLNEALEQQTATSEVLQVISSSPGELEPVFQAMLEKAVRICDANFGNLYLREGDAFRIGATYGASPAYVEFVRTEQLFNLNPKVGLGLLVRTKELYHVADISAVPTHGDKLREATIKLAGARTLIALPMLKDNEVIGAIVIYRQEVRPFTDKQIELVKNFASQAVIAIENTRLLNELRQRTDDLTESLEQQTATSEVLKVISSSPADLAPIFEAMLENATRICAAKFGELWLREGDAFRLGALLGAPPAFAEARWREPVVHPGPNTGLGRIAVTKQPIHIADVRADHAYAERDPMRVILVELAGARAYVAVPMLKEDELIGTIAIYRQEVRPFTDKQIELVTNFASQAVIAIENTRLFNELRESLQRQTATADVLKVISRSTFDLQTVLDTLVESAAHLCDADCGAIHRPMGDAYPYVAKYGYTPEFDEYMRAHPIIPDEGSVIGRAVAEGGVIQIPDVLADLEYSRTERQRIGGFRTVLGIPLVRDITPIGVIVLSRNTVRPFTDKQIELAATFADQAVIAIENVRLFEAEQQRTRELSETLEQQTATSEVLKVISSSPTDIQPVLDAILQTAGRLCESEYACFFKLQDGTYHLASSNNAKADYIKYLSEHPISVDRGTVVGRAAVERRTVHIPDCLTDPEYTAHENARIGKHRSLLGVPLLRDGLPVGVIGLLRRSVKPYTEKQIELVKNFAAQAVIAIENTRLLNELRESLQQQTATADVLKVISSSPGELTPVFQAMLAKATHLCEASYGGMWLCEGDAFRAASHHGNLPAEFVDRWRSGTLFRPSPNLPMVRAIKTRQPIQITDLRATEAYREGYPMAVVGVDVAGIRSMVAVPMFKENEPVGVMSIYRKEVRPFTDKHIELVTNFAAQAVIAIENTRLLNELRESLQQQTATADVLKVCLLYTSPSPRDGLLSRMPSSA